MTPEDKIKSAIVALKGSEVELTSDTRLREDLGFDSGALVELTVQVHTMYGVDLGRRSAERKLLPTTVGEVASLLEEP